MGSSWPGTKQITILSSKGFNRADALRSVTLPAYSGSQHLKDLPSYTNCSVCSEPALSFPRYIGRPGGVDDLFGGFKRRLCGLMTPGKRTFSKFLQALERDFLALPELDAYRRVGLRSSCVLQAVGSNVTLSLMTFSV
jgi:hypothetical protein